MRTLVIQICAFNERDTLPGALAALPRRVDGFDRVLHLVVDDGSTDGTDAAAREAGADIVIRASANQGLARAFMTAVEASVSAGADVIVHTDADNQYDARDVDVLVHPILEGRAEVVVGARPIEAIRHFSRGKRVLQRIGSAVVRSLSGTAVDDAPSGFRAYTRDAALRLNVFNSFSYTLETLIQAGQANLRVVSVPVRVNPPMRASRLARSTAHYVVRSSVAILASYLAYRPVRIFGLLAGAFGAPALALGVRYLVLMTEGAGKGHVQSVIVASALGASAVFMLAIGVIAHQLAINRRLLEELRYQQRRRDLGVRVRTDAVNSFISSAPLHLRPDSGHAAAADGPSAATPHP